MSSDTDLEAILATPAAEVEAMVTIASALALDAEWSLQRVLEAGLYEEADPARLAMVRSDSEIILVSSVGELRSRILPMTWFGRLGDSLRLRQPPPRVPGSWSLADLCRLASAERDIPWYLVVDESSGRPMGILSRQAIEQAIPHSDAEEGSECLGLRGVTFGVKAPHSRAALVYFYCEDEDRCYFPFEIVTGEGGQRECPRGHPVARREA